MQFKDFHHLDTQAIVGQILEPQNIVSFGSSQKFNVIILQLLADCLVYTQRDYFEEL